MSRAFDGIWRKALLVKLLRYNIGGHFYKTIKAMYKDANCCVKTQEGFSQIFKTSRGVKQGEVLSPTLFNLFINDIPNIFDNECNPVILKSWKVNTLMYADDIILVSRTQ